MNVFIPYPDKLSYDNPFIKTLIKSLKEKGISVFSGLNNFWGVDNYSYDIINIHWPEAIFNWKNPSKQDFYRYKEKIIHLKQSSKIVYTRHNEFSHSAKFNSILNEIYYFTETIADSIVHLGSYSRNQFMNDNRHHFIIPHHIYDEYYNFNIDKKTARLKLKISSEKIIILSFGSFRNKEERQLLIKFFSLIKGKNLIILAPHYYLQNPRISIKHHPFIRINNEIKLFINKIKGLELNGLIIPDELVPFYFAAADFIFIQRLNNLNSGNIPLAFLFKKIVIGPNCGNMKEILEITQNPIFDINNLSSLKEAYKYAINLNKNDHGRNNFNYAIKNLSTNRISDQYINSFKFIIGK